MRESVLEAKCMTIAKKAGWKCYKFTSPGHVAVPDRIILRSSVVLFIEFKAPGKRPTKLQARELRLINECGLRAVWCDNIEWFTELIGEYNVKAK